MYLILGVVLIDNYIYIALSGGVERGTVGFLNDMMENRCQYKNILNHRKLMNRLTHFLLLSACAFLFEIIDFLTE